MQSAPPSPQPAPSARKAVIAYLFPQERLLSSDEISAAKLTRLNYAFANLKKGELVAGFPHDQENLKTLVALKQRNPLLQVLISVGGWSWSGGFSDMALTLDGRTRFIDSAIQFIKENQLDGLDVDWEYPGQSGKGNRHRPEDRQTFTALLAETRARLNREEKTLGRRLLLTIAAGASEEFLLNTDMRQVERSLDSVNLMSYDLYVPGVDRITGHHAPLYSNPADPKHVSVDGAVSLFRAAGVPARKLVLGVPFYGHAWKAVADLDHGLFQRGKKTKTEPDYKAVVALLADHNYVRYFDRIAGAPYLYNAGDQIFVSYEDPESIRLKCRYLLKNKLGGIMFWEYSGDANQSLLNAIDRALK